MITTVVLAIVAVVSLLLGVVNLIFYARLWWVMRAWGTAILALLPLLPISRGWFEASRAIAALMAEPYTVPEYGRILVGTIAMIVTIVQFWALVVKFGPALIELEQKRRTER
jgi:hypothetical protein